MATSKRAMRRYHRERLLRRRLRQWNYGAYYPWTAREMIRYIDTPCTCSCPYCGNPRKWFKQPTLQERRAAQVERY